MLSMIQTFGSKSTAEMWLMLKESMFFKSQF